MSNRGRDSHHGILDFGFLIFDSAIQNPKSKIQNVFLVSRRKGQASLEMTLALLGAMLLMLAGFKVCLWAWERVVTRQQYYESTRVAAGSSDPGVWHDPASGKELKIFNE